MLENPGNQLVQVLLVSNPFKSQIWLAIEFKHFHLLTLITDDLTATSIAIIFAATLIEDTTNLNVGALSTTLGTKSVVTIETMQ